MEWVRFKSCKLAKLNVSYLSHFLPVEFPFSPSTLFPSLSCSGSLSKLWNRLQRRPTFPLKMPSFFSSEYSLLNLTLVKHICIYKRNLIFWRIETHVSNNYWYYQYNWTPKEEFFSVWEFHTNDPNWSFCHDKYWTFIN